MGMAAREVAWVTAESTYAGAGRHLVTSVLTPSAPGRFMNNCEVYLHVQLITDDGTVLESADSLRDWFPANPAAPYMYMGSDLEQGQKIVQDIASQLTNLGFYVVENGPYWYNLKLERTINEGDYPLNYEALRGEGSSQAGSPGKNGGHPILAVVLVVAFIIFLFYVLAIIQNIS